jgi:hypothetical protein
MGNLDKSKGKRNSMAGTSFKLKLFLNLWLVVIEISYEKYKKK